MPDSREWITGKADDGALVSRAKSTQDGLSLIERACAARPTHDYIAGSRAWTGELQADAASVGKPRLFHRAPTDAIHGPSHPCFGSVHLVVSRQPAAKSEAKIHQMHEQVVRANLGESTNRCGTDRTHGIRLPALFVERSKPVELRRRRLIDLAQHFVG